MVFVRLQVLAEPVTPVWSRMGWISTGLFALVSFSWRYSKVLGNPGRTDIQQPLWQAFRDGKRLLVPSKSWVQAVTGTPQFSVHNCLFTRTRCDLIQCVIFHRVSPKNKILCQSDKMHILLLNFHISWLLWAASGDSNLKTFSHLIFVTLLHLFQAP